MLDGALWSGARAGLVECEVMSLVHQSKSVQHGEICASGELWRLERVNLSAMQWVVFDLETTGLSPRNDAILEIGAVVVEGAHVTDERFHSLINPGRPIPWFVTRVHGIQDRMVASSPRLETVLPAFLEFVGDRTLVAHNAGFDMGFLSEHASRLGLSAPRTAHCTMELSRRIFPGERRHNLDALCARLGLEASSRHRALSDAEVTAQAFVRLSDMIAAREPVR